MTVCNTFCINFSLKLNVEKVVLPVDNALTQKIGIISGVLLAIVFLILLLLFCCFVCCNKRRWGKKRSRPPSSQVCYTVMIR